MHLSFSSLKAFGKSPKHFIQYKLEKFEPTPAMKFGTLVHAAILEPDKFDNDFVVCSSEPTTDKQIAFAQYLINIGKDYTPDNVEFAYRNNYPKGNPDKLFEELKEYIDLSIEGKNIITLDEKNHAKSLRDEAWSNKASKWLLNEISGTEYKIKWKYKEWDIVSVVDGFGDSLFLDIKVTDSDPETFARQIYKMQNYTQVAMYDMAFKSIGKPKKDKFFLGIDKFGNISVNKVEQDYIYYGERQFKKWVHDFEKAILFKSFKKSYDFYGRKGIHTLKMPSFAREINDFGIE